jgi:adenylate cyclase
MVDVVFEFEGTLDKYIGDALMAVFGSPVVHADDPLRAVQTALKMREELIALNKKWTEKDGLPPICIGIGINTGNVISGNIGHLQRMEYTVIGDNVNIASRIEGLTKQYDCSIIISESTYELVKDQVSVHPLESVKVKGKNIPILVYELMSMKGDSPYSGCSQ